MLLVSSWLSVLALAAEPATLKSVKKIYLMTDMEGVAGVRDAVDWLGPEGRYYEWDVGSSPAKSTRPSMASWPAARRKSSCPMAMAAVPSTLNCWTNERIRISDAEAAL